MRLGFLRTSSCISLIVSILCLSSTAFAVGSGFFIPGTDTFPAGSYPFPLNSGTVIGEEGSILGSEVAAGAEFSISTTATLNNTVGTTTHNFSLTVTSNEVPVMMLDGVAMTNCNVNPTAFGGFGTAGTQHFVMKTRRWQDKMLFQALHVGSGATATAIVCAGSADITAPNPQVQIDGNLVLTANTTFTDFAVARVGESLPDHHVASSYDAASDTVFASLLTMNYLNGSAIGSLTNEGLFSFWNLVVDVIDTNTGNVFHSEAGENIIPFLATYGLGQPMQSEIGRLTYYYMNTVALSNTYNFILDIHYQ